MKKFLLNTGIACLLFAHSLANRPLTVGDKIPQFQISSLLNFATSTGNFETFKGPIILDFWSTTCTACLQGFRDLDSIQQQLTGFTVLLVNSRNTRDDITRINSWLNKRRKANNEKYTWPVIYDDTVLSAFFPNRLLPHYVWIDANGIVRAITGSEELTIPNLQQFIAGRTLSLKIKQDVMDYNPRIPLLQDGNGGGTESLLFRSVFTRHLPGLPASSGTSTDAGKTLKRRYYLNSSILPIYASLYKLAGTNRVSLEVRNAERFIRSDNVFEQWNTDNTYCYELFVPFDTPLQAINEKLQLDLEVFMRVYGRVEKRMMPCYVLQRIDSNDRRLLTKGAVPLNKLTAKDAPIKKILNKPFSDFITTLNFQFPGRPLRDIVLDETGIDFPIDMELNIANIYDLEKLSFLLTHLGLQMIKTKRELEVFVLIEKDSQQQKRSTSHE